jgi:hypothetical protein
MSDLDHVCLSDIQFSAVTKTGFKDVSILTAGEAQGHGVMVDEKTISDFVKLSLGKTIPAYAASYPATMGRLLEEINTTLGVDISKVITGTASKPAPVRG